MLEVSKAWTYIGLLVVVTPSFGSRRVLRKPCLFLIITIYTEDGSRLCACLCMPAFCMEGKGGVYGRVWGRAPMECLHD